MLLSSSRKNAELEAKITELEAKIADLQPAVAAVDELEAKLGAAIANSSSLAAEKADLSTKLEIANTDVTTLKTDKTELTGKLEAASKDVEKQISEGIVKGLSEAGVEAIVRDPKAPDADSKPQPAQAKSGFDRILAATRDMLAKN